MTIGIGEPFQTARADYASPRLIRLFTLLVVLGVSGAMSKRTADDDFLKQYLPTSFGKRQKTYDASGVIDHTRKKKVAPMNVVEKDVGPKAPEPVYTFGVDVPEVDETAERERLEGDYGEEYEEFDEENPYRIPYTHEVEMKGHEGVVSALALDPSGARLISGGFESTIKFWDFPAMDTRLHSFRSIEPDADIINELNYSPSGDRFVMASTAQQARIFNREGKELVEFAKGYPYITNLASTKGHIAAVTAAFWHTKKKDYVVTSSIDSSIRLWHVESAKRQHKQIIKIKSEGGPRAGVTACSMSADGAFIAAAISDGSVQIFDGDGPWSRPKLRCSDAHVNGSETSDIRFAQDNSMFLTRGGDDTVKVWDVRMFKGAVKVFDNLPNKYSMSRVAWSPDQRLFVVGTSVMKDSEGVGKLVFFDSVKMEKVKEVSVAPASIVSLLWHPKLNQIICGGSDKLIRVLYNPEYSTKGVMYCLTKHPKKQRLEDVHIADNTFVPREAREKGEFYGGPRRERFVKRVKRPEPPQEGVGVGGRVGTSLTASIMSNLIAKTPIDDDPREALLKYHDPSGQSLWFEAYKETQPKAIFSKTEEDDKDKKFTNVPKM